MHFFVNISNIALPQIALATIMSMNFDFDNTFFAHVVCDDMSWKHVVELQKHRHILWTCRSHRYIIKTCRQKYFFKP